MPFQIKNMRAKCYVCGHKNPRICEVIRGGDSEASSDYEPQFKWNQVWHRNYSAENSGTENWSSLTPLTSKLLSLLSSNVLNTFSFRLTLMSSHRVIGNADLVLDLVKFCDFCNKEFMGNKSFRDRRTHYEHLTSKFEEITPKKSENYLWMWVQNPQEVRLLAPYGWKASTN